MTDDSYRGAFAVTPSDSTDLSQVRGLYIGGAGDLAVRMRDTPTVTVTFKAPPVGTLLPLNVTRVMAATTATLIIALT